MYYCATPTVLSTYSSLYVVKKNLCILYHLWISPIFQVCAYKTVIKLSFPIDSFIFKGWIP